MEGGFLGGLRHFGATGSFGGHLCLAPAPLDFMGMLVPLGGTFSLCRHAILGVLPDLVRASMARPVSIAEAWRHHPGHFSVLLSSLSDETASLFIAFCISVLS